MFKIDSKVIVLGQFMMVRKSSVTCFAEDKLQNAPKSAPTNSIDPPECADHNNLSHADFSLDNSASVIGGVGNSRTPK